MSWHLITAVAIGISASVAFAQTRAASPEGDSLSRIRFRTVVICDSFPAGYQVAVADMNGDRRPDIVALGENPGTVEWFESPGREQAPWRRHPISDTLTRRNIDLAINDADNDRYPDVAVASDFDLGRSDQGGTVSWFHRRDSKAEEWAAVRIHAVPTAHRVRWADVDGDKRKELITVPIVGEGAKIPTTPGKPVRLTCHRVPRDPVRDVWPGQVFDESLTVVHGVCVLDWDGDGRDELLTASNQGIHLFKAQGRAVVTRWTRTHLAAGRSGEAPNCGSSEVSAGRGRNGARFLAAIEPWHGNEVVVYTPPAGDTQGPWQRKVIDDSLRAGHALCCADLDGDGRDEIVAGYRGHGISLLGYHAVSNAPGRWERFDIDAGGIAAQGCVAADMDGDGRTDLVATGGTTHNVKLYLNVTATEEEDQHP